MPLPLDAHSARDDFAGSSTYPQRSRSRRCLSFRAILLFHPPPPYTLPLRLSFDYYYTLPDSFYRPSSLINLLSTLLDRGIAHYCQYLWDELVSRAGGLDTPCSHIVRLATSSIYPHPPPPLPPRHGSSKFIKLHIVSEEPSGQVEPLSLEPIAPSIGADDPRIDGD